jgi:hypothetical protein
MSIMNFSSILQWLHDNREWVFSGVGVSLAIALFSVTKWGIQRRKLALGSAAPSSRNFSRWDAVQVLQGHWVGTS